MLLNNHLFLGDVCSCAKIGRIAGKSKQSKSLKEKGHVGQVLCLALSTDFKYLVKHM